MHFRIVLFLLPICLFAKVSLDQEMTKAQMQETGVDQLNATQKQALETWIEDNYESKADRLPQKEKQLYLSLNVDNGAQLELSDGTSYEVAPEDRLYSSYWITPFPVMMGRSDHPDYPIKITNLNSGTSVNAKRISKKTILQEAQPQVEETYPEVEREKPKPQEQPKLQEKPKEKPKTTPKKQKKS